MATDFTLSSGSIMRPFRSPWGNFPTRNMPVISTNAVVKVGQVVTISAAGSSFGANAVNNNTSTGGLNLFSIVGVAAEGAPVFVSSATQGPTIAIWEANPLVEFKAVTKGAVLASSHVGKRKCFAYDSAKDIHWIDLTGSTATDWRVVITGLVDGIGDSGGYVSFRFLTSLGEQIESTTILSSSPLLAFYS